MTIAYAESIENGMADVRTANLRVLTLADENGESIVIDESQTIRQVEQFNIDFAPMGLQFTYTVETINSTFLRHGFVIPYECPVSSIGDGNMDLGCLTPINDYDGGDFVCRNPSSCNPICTYDNIYMGVPGTSSCSCICVPYHTCSSAMRGDGICQDDCNHAATNFDNGDCCLDPYAGTCRDHRRSFGSRSFADMTEIRALFGVDHGKELSVIVGPLADDYLAGIATFPWTVSYDDPRYGGFIMSSYYWGENPDLRHYGSIPIHEAGHCLGLFHVHTGVTEVYGCSDRCFESQPPPGQPSSMTTGDMFSDTRPTPVNYRCFDPPSCGAQSSIYCQDCNRAPWVETPFANIMSYASQEGTCTTKVFTPQQYGRMRCYYDMYFSNWDKNEEPGMIVLPPEVYPASAGIYVTWESPINTGSRSGMTYILERTSGNSSTLLPVSNAYYYDTSVQTGIEYSYRVLATIGSLQAKFFSPSASATFQGINATPSPTPGGLEHRIVYNTNGSSLLLGSQIVISGDRAVATQPGCLDPNAAISSCGVVYLMQKRSGVWRVNQILKAMGERDGAMFGAVVAFNGDSLLVSSPAPVIPGSADQDVVYGFEYSESSGRFSRRLSIRSRVKQEGQMFGSALALDRGLILIAAPGLNHQTLHANAGAVYVFSYSNSQQAKSRGNYHVIHAPTFDQDARFGTKIAAKDGVVAVADRLERVYCYRFDSVSATHFQTLRKPSTQDHRFGSVLIFSAGMLFVSAEGYSADYRDQGIVHVYTPTGTGQYSRLSSLLPNDSHGGQNFGRSLAFDDNSMQLAVGSGSSPGCQSASCKKQSSVYVFQSRNTQTWSQVHNIQLGKADGSDSFGQAVAIDSSGLLVGAPTDNTHGANRGAVYSIAT
eukprot:TRINITY_DN450_c0_g1_i2.p1 TRINITY_DN450_c0_g1~~TRINITY_DN450_c0_g1_i2.p1  ORF type:complete len:882 (-),score=128.50 TRINITY_DN450_c0_g1_i2:171-2816(-)